MLRILELFEPIAVGDVQDYDIDFTQYVQSSGEALDDEHEIGDVIADPGLTIQQQFIHNGDLLDGTISCFVKVWVTATVAGTYQITVPLLTAAGRKHTVAVKVRFQ